jgi:hypothetical protein
MLPLRGPFQIYACDVTLLADYADCQRDRGGCSNTNERQSRSPALVAIEPVREQQANSYAECHPSTGDENEVWDTESSFHDLHTTSTQKSDAEAAIGDHPEPELK